MERLRPLLSDGEDWTIIGSSFGGLMAALYARERPERVRKLILLAPALIWPDFASDPPESITVPTVIYHGRDDDVIPLDAVKPLAEGIFENLTFNIVDDDHKLHDTVKNIDWHTLIKGSQNQA
jgi:pimeloyl-ACP methyl ester carboxylesterase